MTFVITAACVDVKDKTCIDECPVDCIYEGPRKLYIQPEECIDCGACETVCPVQAILFEDDLDPGERPALVWAQELFATVGSPGGSRRHGPLAADHPEVAALPTAS